MHSHVSESIYLIQSTETIQPNMRRNFATGLRQVKISVYFSQTKNYRNSYFAAREKPVVNNHYIKTNGKSSTANLSTTKTPMFIMCLQMMVISGQLIHQIFHV